MNETYAQLILIVLGQILPPLTDLINKHVPSSKLRYVISVLVCLLVALGFNFDNLRAGSVDEFLLTASLVFASAQTAYKMYYDGSKVQNTIRFSTKVLPL